VGRNAVALAERVKQNPGAKSRWLDVRFMLLTQLLHMRLALTSEHEAKGIAAGAFIYWVRRKTSFLPSNVFRFTFGRRRGLQAITGTVFSGATSTELAPYQLAF